MPHVDLHTHTRYSDGTNRPEQIVVDSAANGLDVIAITDHDITTGFYEAKNEAHDWGITAIPGVEVSTTKYHILGYAFDVENRELKELLRYSRECQLDTTKKRVALIAGAGVPITIEKVVKAHHQSRIGKFNIAYTMLKDPECLAYHGRLSCDEIFVRYMDKGTIGFNIDDQKSVKSKEAIDAIHAAGGIAVVAHPFKQANSPEDLDRLVKNGIDGLEVQPNYNGRNEPFIGYAKEHGLLITYGSDYHGMVFPHRPLLCKNGNVIEPFWDRVLV